MKETCLLNVYSYKTADGRYFHTHGSLNATPTLDMLGLPHHRLDLEGNIEGCKDVYRAAVAEKDSVSLEAEANERWLQPGVICRTVEEYAATPHGKLNIEESLYAIYKTHEQLPRTPWPPSRTPGAPLAGIKVLDLTKVIAGPTITRVLALMGADVLRVSTDTQPEAVPFIADGQIGKRDTDINLKTPEGKVQFENLLQEADVVVSSYRPGVFERMGLGRNWVHELARRRGKGVVYCRENCYGWSGEWSGRAGYQQISDCVRFEVHLSIQTHETDSSPGYWSSLGTRALPWTRRASHAAATQFRLAVSYKADFPGVTS